MSEIPAVSPVSDTGIGLTSEQAARLFRPFEQADATTARQYGGTGLGLSICHQLCELMDGNIHVESQPGAGATFVISLELPEADAPSSGASLASEPAVEPALRVLVVDDNPTSLAVARALLETLDADVVTVQSGQDALDSLRCRAVDVVLMDIHMPGMDGCETLRRIRCGEAGPATVPVIALTGEAGLDRRQALLAVGFDGVEPKPIVPATLFATLQACTAAASEAAPTSAASA